MRRTKELSAAAKISRVLSLIVLVIALITLFFFDKPLGYFEDLVKNEQTCMIKTFGREQVERMHEKADQVYHETLIDSNVNDKVRDWFRPTEKEIQNGSLPMGYKYYKAAELIIDATINLLYILQLRWQVFLISLGFAAVAFAVLLFRGYTMRSTIKSNRNFPHHPLHKWALRVKPCLKWLLLIWFLNPFSLAYYHLGCLLILLAMCYCTEISVAYLYKNQ